MSSRLILLALVLVACGSALAAAGAEFKSTSARRAASDHDAAIKVARIAYQKAVLAADQKYLKSLKEGLDASMEKKDLDEAKRIEAEMVQVKDRVKSAEPADPAAEPADTSMNAPAALLGDWVITNNSGGGKNKVTLRADHFVARENGAVWAVWMMQKGVLSLRYNDGNAQDFDETTGAELRGKNAKGDVVIMVRR